MPHSRHSSSFDTLRPTIHDVFLFGPSIVLFFSLVCYRRSEAMASLTFVSSQPAGRFHPSISQESRAHSLLFHRGLQHRRSPRLWISSRSGCVTASSPSPSIPSPSSPGIYSAKIYELTTKNVDLVLEDVRPYLIADGGNVDVVSVEDGVISLKLQGACGTCPSSTTTMQMGIERVLREKFGNAVKDICQVLDEQPATTTVEAVDGHLNILRPAIKNYGGSVEVLSVKGEDCHVRYTGPESIASGIKAAIKEKFPDIVNVVFTA